MGSCSNVIDWKIPYKEGNTIIFFVTKKRILTSDIIYIKESLRDEFNNNYFEIKMIAERERDSGGALNLKKINNQTFLNEIYLKILTDCTISL